MVELEVVELDVVDVGCVVLVVELDVDELGRVVDVDELEVDDDELEVLDEVDDDEVLDVPDVGDESPDRVSAKARPPSRRMTTMISATIRPVLPPPDGGGAAGAYGAES